MSGSDGPSKQQVFLHAYRAVRRVMDAATSLAEQLEADPEARYAFSAERAGAAYFYQDLNWDHVFPFVGQLKEALQDDLVQALHDETIADIQIALRYADEALPVPGQTGGDPRILAEVVDHLELDVQQLVDMCYGWAKAAFGVWGGYWFTVAASGQFSLDYSDPWPEIELSPAEILAVMTEPERNERKTDESGRKWADPEDLLSPTQRAILDALDGRALKKEDLAEAVFRRRDQGNRLYRFPGIKELMKRGLVKNVRPIGYYRPDAPPPDAIPPEA